MRLFVLLLIAFVAGEGGSERQRLLTNNSHQPWFLASVSISGADSSCEPAETVTIDNTYTFHADGTFEFSTGANTEEPSCDSCCVDLVNYIGKWVYGGWENFRLW